jgi:hypothetical protein
MFVEARTIFYPKEQSTKFAGIYVEDDSLDVMDEGNKVVKITL